MTALELIPAVDRFLALSCALIYNDIVTNYRTIIFNVLGKLVLLMVTGFVFLVDQDVQDCDKALYSAPVFFNSKTFIQEAFC